MRKFRRDLFSLLTVLTVVLAVVAVFPFDGLRFRAAASAVRPASAAFVTLTEAEEAEALQVAKTAWQVGPSGFRRLRAPLIVGELPECPHGPVEPSPAAMAHEEAGVRPAAPTAYPTGSIEPPRELAAEPPAPRALPFPKEELLKID